MSSAFTWPTGQFRCASVQSDAVDAPVDDRQRRVPGFRQDALHNTDVLLIGAGGLIGLVAAGAARKGLGLLDICDPDVVEVSNLNRQYFFWCDVEKPKAIRLARNAAMAGHLGTECWGHQVAFTAETAPILARGKDVVVCGVDNNETRAVASRFCRQNSIPVIFTAVNEDANFGYVFVQEPTGPCLACIYPRIANAGAERERCRTVPAVLDILMVMGGIVLYAIDSLVMERRRAWNYRSVHLVGGCPDFATTELLRPTCRLCGGSAAGVTEASSP